MERFAKWPHPLLAKNSQPSITHVRPIAFFLVQYCCLNRSLVAHGGPSTPRLLPLGVRCAMCTRMRRRDRGPNREFCSGLLVHDLFFSCNTGAFITESQSCYNLQRAGHVALVVDKATPPPANYSIQVLCIDGLFYYKVYLQTIRQTHLSSGFIVECPPRLEKSASVDKHPSPIT